MWMRNEDQFFSDTDFIISYPVYFDDSNKLKGYCIKFLEVKSTKNYYEHFSKEFFQCWANDRDKNRNKYWYDFFELYQ